MSQEFAAIFAAPAQDAGSVLIAVDQSLADLGFRRGNTLSRLELEKNIEEEISHFGTLSAAAPRIKDWSGASISFQSRDFGIAVAAYSWKQGFHNCYVSLPWKRFIELFQSGKRDLYYASLFAVAGASATVAGFADVGLDPDPFSPDDAVARIKDNPAKPGSPSSLGLISQKRMKPAEVRAFASQAFVLREVSGYWLLEEKDYLAVYGTLAT
jgi:hypothetical protein